MEASPDETVQRAITALASPVRLAILRELRAPLPLHRIEVRAPGEEGRPSRLLARQTVREHLDRLLEARLVVVAEEPEGRLGPSYVANHRALFELGEAFHELARQRPLPDPAGMTSEARVEPRALPSGPVLVSVKGPEAGHAFALAGGTRWVIGRRRDVAISLDYDPFLSGENALVEWTGDGHSIEDIPGSRNGTSVNFAPLRAGERRKLVTGDLVGVGRSLLLYRA